MEDEQQDRRTQTSRGMTEQVILKTLWRNGETTEKATEPNYWGTDADEGGKKTGGGN